MQIDFSSSVFLFTIILLIFLTEDWHVRPGRVLLLGACLLLLALHAPGIALAPPVAAAMAYAGVRNWRSGEVHRRRIGMAIIALAVIAVLLVVLSLFGLGSGSGSRPSPVQFFTTAVQFASTSLGFVAGRGWPLTGLLMVGLYTLTAAALILAWRFQPTQRVRVLGLFMILAATVVFAAAIGLVRPSGLAPVYGLISTPALLCIYFIWGLYSPSSIARFLQMGLFTLMCASVTYHATLGSELGKARRDATQSFEQDIRGGMPLTGVVGRQTPYWCNYEELLRKGLQELHDHGTGDSSFKQIVPDPPMEEIALPTEPTTLHGMTWEERSARAVNADPYLTYDLGRKRFVYAIRLTFTLTNGSDVAAFQVLWDVNDSDGTKQERGMLYPFKLTLGPAVKTQTIWVNDRIDSFRIYPDKKACTLQIREIVLLVKPGSD